MITHPATLTDAWRVSQGESNTLWGQTRTEYCERSPTELDGQSHGRFPWVGSGTNGRADGTCCPGAAAGVDTVDLSA